MRHSLSVPAGGAARGRRGAVSAALGLLAVALSIAALSLLRGSYGLSADQVWLALNGQADAMGHLIILEMRLPRLIAAVVVGICLGVAGAIFQGLCRNPLASPDVMGFTTGAATGALAGILLLGASGTAIGALLGGAGAGLLVQLVSRGRLRGDSFILSGVGVTAMLAAFNEYLVTRVDLEKAEMAKTWLFGSLAGASWSHLVLAVPAMIILLVAVAVLWPRMRLLAMGDDLATALGLPTRSSRLWLTVFGICLTVLATTLAGPVHFLALAAAPLARRLFRTPDSGLAGSAAMGAVLMMFADFLAQRLMAPFQIPVGLITGAVGGVYLVVLLSWSRRKGKV
ncbi:hypothetical protein CWS72_02540 [Telmatospirillum siberiense]|uniref:Uncharacterized protein n=2 Tax=Telmatospirillum siberiense TaxID=382514 RepID=A0A2N3Q0Q1_9PROT|nr:hypothetical protein CWS72_02540 [Telmatospirillum siberiense]